MMRLARMAFLLASTLTIASTMAAEEAQSVEDISKQINSLQTQYENFSGNIAQLEQQKQKLEDQLANLRKRNDELENARQAALDEMNKRYQLLVEDPTIDIVSAQNAYKEAVMAHQQNKENIKTQVNLLEAKNKELQQARVSKHSLINEIEVLKEQRNLARVERIQQQFNQKGTIEVSQSIVCDREETLSQCETRGKLLAKQKASKQYLSQLFDQLSESELARTNREKASPNVQILGSQVVSNGFSGQGNYGVKLSVELRGQLQETQACTLLDVDLRYCVVEAKKDEGSADGETAASIDPSVMHKLTVRSNVYDDEVLIDGVSYGSTPLEVMLPAGEHEVDVVKFGYSGYNNTIILKDANVIRVELEKAAYSFTKGEKIQDVLYRDVRGPELVVVPAGRFKMGDLSGNGLPNERPAQTKEIEQSFGISETEITVASFRNFVEDTAYVTDAEKSGTCAVLSEGKPIFNANINWREPGFQQKPESPVVCVSYNDAKAYVDWLSQKSGAKYRLPTEAEWEYAARAGTETDYWWGQNVGVDKANCRACGTPWSNVSSAPVASFKRNPWGLFDTVGNVWEWARNEADGTSSVRGGAWNFAPSLARVSTRMELPSDFASNYIGFRVIREQ
ncbi:sulfatase modifying factor 1 [Idiomarina tyrosinivorans]|uniref:Sulfatase modifying factor 1 n=1 Tax=Idiomarina tyrosinivorans TaxID=1445662 RepID=A0A432ZQL7_9GAMM|nr:formylglycine-generating enzyme family protein [Idiomarina tyrosinivorans]RUO80131.1 sulfatase modifying factor 1 [Idiomarina tyrosinivorans]